MAPRRLEAWLAAGAAALLMGQLVLLAVLRASPEPPAQLPALDIPLRNTPFAEGVEQRSASVESVVRLDQLLAERLAAAAVRTGADPARLAPAATLRAAALAHPDPVGPEVGALIEAYARALGALGESLDAGAPPTSTPAP